MLKNFLVLALLLSLSVAGAQQARYMTNLEVYPGSVTMEAGDIIQFTVVARSHSGMMHTPQQGLRWYATGGIVTPTGLFTAGQTGGNFNVTAEYGGQRANAGIEIKSLQPIPQPITRIVITPPTLRMRIGEARQFTATAYDQYNRPLPFQPRWNATGGGSINYTGYFYATMNGSYTITATDPNSSAFGSAMVVIGSQQGSSVARLEIFPRNAEVRRGQTCQFSATAYDSYGQVVFCNLDWRATGGTVNNGFYTAGPTPGSYYVWVREPLSGIETNATIRVSGGGHHGGGDGRIVISEWDAGGGNFFRPKAKITLQVYGQNLQTIKLYTVSSSGDMQELQAYSCTNGATVRFDCRYDRFNAKWLEIRLYDNMNQIVAREKRSVE